MKVLTTIFFSILTLSTSFGALPKWTDDDLAKINSGTIIAGSAFFDSPINLDNQASLLPPPAEPEVEIDRPLVIRPVIVDPSKHKLPPINDNRKMLSNTLVHRYFKQAISEGMVDPQNLLSSKERLDVEYALERYADESPVSIYFYLFDKNQRVPDTHSAQTVFNSFYYSEPSAVVVYYFIEEPERCQVYFGGKDANLIATNKIRNLVSGIKIGAKKRSNKISQLDEFIRQLSLHMYWIEKSMIADVYEPIENIIPNQSNTLSKTSVVADKVYVGLNRFSQYWWVIALGSLCLVLALLAGVYWVKSRQFLFPSLATKPRLTLPNGGSAGGILSYNDENQPPSAQRKQFDNPFK